jgi:hypothetical protein
MKSELIYHGKYDTFGKYDHCQIVRKDELNPNSPPNLLGVLIQMCPTGFPPIWEPMVSIPILEGEGCPIDGFPPASNIHPIYIGEEIPF